jgi:cytochrome c553
MKRSNLLFSDLTRLLGVAFLLSFFSEGFASSDMALGKEKSVVCAACHGETGLSANPIWPNLAGQHEAYLVKQLHDFKQEKLRHSPVMAPFVAALTEEDMHTIAHFYSKQPKAVDAGKNNTRGEKLYRTGHAEKHITACIACHGPDALGNPAAGFPVLANQKAEYTFSQLQAFKSKDRCNDLNEIMQTISARMSEQDMRDVADYLEHIEKK